MRRREARASSADRARGERCRGEDGLRRLPPLVALLRRGLDRDDAQPRGLHAHAAACGEERCALQLGRVHRLAERRQLQPRRLNLDAATAGPPGV